MFFCFLCVCVCLCVLCDLLCDAVWRVYLCFFRGLFVFVCVCVLFCVCVCLFVRCGMVRCLCCVVFCYNCLCASFVI